MKLRRGFRKNQKVEFWEKRKLEVPKEWRGVLTFVEYYKLKPGMCYVSNGSSRISDYACEFVSAEPVWREFIWEVFGI